MTENAKNVPQDGLAEELLAYVNAFASDTEGLTLEAGSWNRLRELIRRAALRQSPQPAEQQEAVAWLWRYIDRQGNETARGLSESKINQTDNAFWESDETKRISTVVTPLYAHPPSVAPREAQPEVCCGQFATCVRPCTPRGAWNERNFINREAQQAKPSEGAQRDAERYRILRALGCVYADQSFSHGDALCTPGRVGGDYADSFADAALSRRPA